MNLYVDIGNSNLKISDDNNLFLKIKNTKNQDLKTLLVSCKIDYGQLKNVWISSVVPSVNDIVSLFFQEKSLKVTFVNANNFFFLKLPSDAYKQIGIDRLLVADSGIEKYGPDLIIFDFGTASTVEVIQNSTYLTG